MRFDCQILSELPDRDVNRGRLIESILQKMSPKNVEMYSNSKPMIGFIYRISKVSEIRFAGNPATCGGSVQTAIISCLMCTQALVFQTHIRPDPIEHLGFYERIFVAVMSIVSSTLHLPLHFKLTNENPYFKEHHWRKSTRNAMCEDGGATNTIQKIIQI